MDENIVAAIKGLTAEKMVAEMNGFAGISVRLQGIIDLLEARPIPSEQEGTK